MFDEFICNLIFCKKILDPEIIWCIRNFSNSFHYKSFEIENYKLNVSNEIDFYSHYFSNYKWVYDYERLGIFSALGINNIGEYLVVSIPIGTCSFCDVFLDRENFFSDEPKVVFDMIEKIDEYIDKADITLNPIDYFESFYNSNFYKKIKKFINDLWKNNEFQTKYFNSLKQQNHIKEILKKEIYRLKVLLIKNIININYKIIKKLIIYLNILN